MDLEDLKERVRAALPFDVVAAHDGLVLRRAGQGRWTCCCPFHEERSPSFVVGGRSPGRAHCFGCGWDGDVFTFWMERRSVDFKGALEQLAGLAGVPFSGGVFERPAARAPVRRAPEKRLESEVVRPPLPPLRRLTEGECAQIAQGRGLELGTVLEAARMRRIGFTMWPLYQSSYDGQWLERSSGAHPSWLITDGTRRVAEYRRLDGEKYVRADGSGIKAWSTAGKSWPVGAEEIGARLCVLLVEGGPDCLAALQFLRRWRMQDRVAVVTMLGASNRMHEDALRFFEGRRVRVMMDADEPKDGKATGTEAAARWSTQLTEAGAAVEVFSLYGLTLPDGQAVKDVNDLARCAPEVRDAPEIREAFRVWDF